MREKNNKSEYSGVLLLFISIYSGYRPMNKADYTTIKHVMQI